MSTPWPWPPGTIVVCIDARTPITRHSLHSAPLVEGAYYTIREAHARRLPPGHVANGVLLHEIRSNLHASGVEYGFLASRFRPAESTHCERETTRAQQPQKV